MATTQRLYPVADGGKPKTVGAEGATMAGDAIADGLDLRVAELLCSRLCHDMISPVAAINNGLELLADDDGSSAAEISGLLTQSAGQAAGRLMFYRAAYGLGGDQADSLTVADLARLVEGLVEADKIGFRWPRAGETALGRIGSKLLLNAAVMAIEALPRGGRISVALTGEPPETLVIEAEGTGATIRPEVAEALRQDVDVGSLTPRSVHGYFTAWLARSRGGAIEPETRTDAVRLRLVLPPRG
jgi:histidine phosphotransferase ChpT